MAPASVPGPGAAALDTARRELRDDLAATRRLLAAREGALPQTCGPALARRSAPVSGASATRAGARLADVVAARREHASHALAALESPAVLEFLDGLTRDARLEAVTGVATLLVGTPAAAALTQELFRGAAGPLAARLRAERPAPELTRLAVALAPHLDATRGDALSRLAEVALGRGLTTREYVAVQDLATLRPGADVSALVSFAALVAALGEAAAPGGGLPQGARLLQDFHRAWQLREPDEAAWWPPAEEDPERPVDWVAATHRAHAAAAVWLLDPHP